MGADSVIDQVSRAKGAYILLIKVENDLMLEIKSLKNPHVEKGTYLYCGSANGPGGIGARVARYLKRDKKPHWHVDRLTIAFGVRAFCVFEGQSECALVEHLRSFPKMAQPIKTFGSSDCENCFSHLVKIGDDQGLEDFNLGVPVFYPASGPLF